MKIVLFIDISLTYINERKGLAKAIVTKEMIIKHVHINLPPKQGFWVEVKMEQKCKHTHMFTCPGRQNWKPG